jgi:hypothetical protein
MGKKLKDLTGMNSNVKNNRVMKDKGFFLSKKHIAGKVPPSRSFSQFQSRGRFTDETLDNIIGGIRHMGKNGDIKLVRLKELRNFAQNSVWGNFQQFEKEFGVLHNVGGKCRSEIETATRILNKMSDD